MPYPTGWNYIFDYNCQNGRDNHRNNLVLAVVHKFFLVVCWHLNSHISIVASE